MLSLWLVLKYLLNNLQKSTSMMGFAFVTVRGIENIFGYISGPFY